MVELSSSLEALLSVISDRGNREARVALASLSGKLKESLSQSFKSASPFASHMLPDVIIGKQIRPLIYIKLLTLLVQLGGFEPPTS
jgi:hypothetical protein